LEVLPAWEWVEGRWRRSACFLLLMECLDFSPAPTRFWVGPGWEISSLCTLLFYLLEVGVLLYLATCLLPPAMGATTLSSATCSAWVLSGCNTEHTWVPAPPTMDYTCYLAWVPPAACLYTMLAAPPWVCHSGRFLSTCLGVVSCHIADYHLYTTLFTRCLGGGAAWVPSTPAVPCSAASSASTHCHRCTYLLMVF